MAWALFVAETVAGSLTAFWLALGGLAVTAAEVWRHLRSGG